RRAPVGRTNHPASSLRRTRRYDQMHVLGHETIIVMSVGTICRMMPGTCAGHGVHLLDVGQVATVSAQLGLAT
ncbi:MAG: hypothetical protein V3S24_10775, partial [Candidatus Tectomicrobia bacterium]